MPEATNPRSVIYVCAVRYALGRQTYMPSLVAEQVIANLDEITAQDRVTIQQDIEFAIDFRADQLGADVAAWLEVLKALR